MDQTSTLGSPVSFAADGAQYLTFSLGDDEYGVEILKVQEIRGSSPITPLPNTPGHIRGVMNLRGSIIPVVDLRSRLGMGNAGDKSAGVIIVVTVGTQVKGMVVDGVSDVVGIPAAEIKPPPDLDTPSGARFVKGLATIGDKLVILLDSEQVLGRDDEDACPAGAG
jgi:purine-binding chemotaxis protein CheW